MRHALIRVDPPRDTMEGEYVPNHGRIVGFFATREDAGMEILCMNARNEPGLHLYVDAVPLGIDVGAHVCLDDCRGPLTSPTPAERASL